MKRIVTGLGLGTILAILAGCSTNQQGAEAYYRAQIENRKPLLYIAGVDGEPARMEFGVLEVYSNEPLTQFKEDDRWVRGLKTIVDGVTAIAGIVSVAQAVDTVANNQSTSTQTVQTVEPQIVQPDVVNPEIVKPDIVRVDTPTP